MTFVSALTAVVDIMVQSTACTASFATEPTEALEATAAGGTVLRYDNNANQYIYKWATPGPGCYTLFLKLDSGLILSAVFQTLVKGSRARRVGQR